MPTCASSNRQADLVAGYRTNKTASNLLAAIRDGPRECCPRWIYMDDKEFTKNPDFPRGDSRTLWEQKTQIWSSADYKRNFHKATLHRAELSISGNSSNGGKKEVPDYPSGERPL